MSADGFLANALVYLIAAVIAVPVFNRIGLGAVLGFLVAGLVIGPDGLAFVTESEDTLRAPNSRACSSRTARWRATRTAPRPSASLMPDHTAPVCAARFRQDAARRANPQSRSKHDPRQPRT